MEELTDDEILALGDEGAFKYPDHVDGIEDHDDLELFEGVDDLASTEPEGSGN